MSDAPVLLSIIVPCYNVSATIGRALDSILFQQVNFRYEVLCVNDASTDDTADKIREYANRYDWIHLLENPANAGNAETFYNGLKAAKGKYFAVLDGDDFYSLKTKLQKQVDFLENDVKGEFCAVTHYHIVYKDDGTVNIPDFNLGIDDYNYQNFLEIKYHYHHTSAYMFRNIYKGNPPEIMKKDVMRGDHPRIFIELILTNKKVKVLPFFCSVYNYNFKVAVLGLTFKPGTDDLREAPSLVNVPLLLENGAHICAYDPVGIPNFRRRFPSGIEYCHSAEEALRDADVCFIFTEWPEITALVPVQFKAWMKNALIFDGRNIWKPTEMAENGVEYYSIGR